MKNTMRAFVERKDRRTGESYFVANPRSPQERMASLRKLAAEGKHAAREAERSLRLANKHAYQMATRIIKMRREWPRELEAKIAPATFDEFIRETFAPLIMLGGDPFELLRQIESGLTLRDYLDREGPTLGDVNRATVAGRIGL